MYVARLALTNFRNYAAADWQPDAATNIIYGDNGQGKTNLLEAVYLLSTAKSFRTSRDRELINWEAAKDPIITARLEVDVVRGRQRLRLELALLGRKEPASPEAPSEASQLAGIAQKKLRVNGIARTAADFIGQANAVLFSSQDIEVIGGPPSLRRRYLDDMKTQVDRRYLRTLSAYNRILEQRNHLLRLILEEKASTDQLEFWDRELVNNGGFLIQQRKDVLGQIRGLLQPLHLQLTSGKEQLALKYIPNLEESLDAPDEQAVKEAFWRKLRKYQPREIGAGATLVGPHRDDLAFVVDGIDLGVYGSRGQQRTLALSLKLAEASYLREVAGDSPIILLDDVFSELDARRRSIIMQALPEYGQIMASATELDRFEPSFLAAGSIFHIREGRITTPPPLEKGD